MSHGDRMEALPPGWDVIARDRQLADRRLREPRAHLLRRPVPPRGRAHRPRHRRPAQLSLQGRARPSRPGRWRTSSAVRSSASGPTSAHGRVICALSGGVDSAVAAAIVDRAVGDRLTCVFVDNGLLRAERGRARHRGLPPAFRRAPARRRREHAVPGCAPGVEDPEAKRQRHRPRLHRGLRRRGQDDSRRRVPGAGHPLPRRHRVGVLQGPVRHDQEPPQRRRPPRAR